MGNEVEQKGVETKEGFGLMEVAKKTEVASAAVAAQAKAMIESQYIMAMNRPRSFDDVRTEVLKVCRRPEFAEMARYKKPVGKGVEGPSIRFADEVVKIMRNVNTSKATIYDDDDIRIVRISVMDLETNTCKSQDVTIKKTVERKNPAGRQVIEWRTNTSGEQVAIVGCTDDEMLSKEENVSAKIRRSLELQIIPQDIIEEGQREAINTMRNKAAKDPDAAKKQMLDSFATIGLKATDLEKYLKHGMATVSPAELQELRNIYVAIHNGEATWADYKPEAEAEPSETQKKVHDQIKKKTGKKPDPPKQKSLEPEPEVPDGKFTVTVTGDLDAARESLEQGKFKYEETMNCYALVGQDYNSAKRWVEFLGELKSPDGEVIKLEWQVLSEASGEIVPVEPY